MVTDTIYTDIMANYPLPADLATAIRDETFDPTYLSVLDDIIHRYGYQGAVWPKLSHILDAIRRGIPALQCSVVTDYLRMFPTADPRVDMNKVISDRHAKARKDAGAPFEFLRMSPDDVEDRQEVAGLAQAIRLAREYNVEDVRQGQGLLFFGDPGVGKTMLEVLATDPIVDAGLTVMFATAPAFIEANKPGGNHTWVDKCYAVDLLLVDDLGQERATDYATSEWELLISFRHNEQKATLWTSNLSKSKLLELYGGRIIDRIRDRSAVVELTGPSYRGRGTEDRLFDVDTDATEEGEE